MKPRSPPNGFDVVTIGEPMVLFHSTPGTPLRHAVSFGRSVAGSESNVAVGLARLGHTVQFQSRLSTDALGDVIRSTLRAEGIEMHCPTDTNRPTGVLIRDAHPRRSVEVIYQRAGSASAALCPDDLDLEAIAKARLLHISGITPVLGDSPAAAIMLAVQTARAAQTLVSFDPNLRHRLCPPDQAAEILRPLLELADIVLTGDDEAEMLTGKTAPDAAAAWLEGNTSVVVVKQGASGSWATDGKHRWDQPAMQVTQVDPVGAGDAFAAGFLHGYLCGVETKQALTLGATVAAMVVEVANDIDGLPTLPELETHEGVKR